MTAVIVSPRIENPDSDVESVVSKGYFKYRPSKPYVAGGQWVLDAWTRDISFTGSAITVQMDPLASVPYEFYAWIPNGREDPRVIHEFRLVTASGSPVAWETYVQVTGPEANPVLTNEVDARLDALEANVGGISGGASTLATITDMTAFARTFNDDTTAAAVRTTIGAAPVDSPTFTTTAAAPTPTAGDATTKIATTAFVDASFAKKASPVFTTALTAANPTFTGTVTIPDNALAIADTSGLQTALDAKAALASPTFTGNPVAPTQTAGNNSTRIATTAFVKAEPIGYAQAPAGSRFDIQCVGGIQPLRPSARTDIFFDWLMVAQPSGAVGYDIDGDGWRAESW